MLLDNPVQPSTHENVHTGNDMHLLAALILRAGVFMSSPKDQVSIPALKTIR